MQIIYTSLKLKKKPRKFFLQIICCTFIILWTEQVPAVIFISNSALANITRSHWLQFFRIVSNSIIRRKNPVNLVILPFLCVNFCVTYCTTVHLSNLQGWATRSVAVKSHISEKWWKLYLFCLLYHEIFREISRKYRHRYLTNFQNILRN